MEPPEIYLGGRIAKKSLNGKDILTMSSVNYVKGMIMNAEVRIVIKGMRLSRRSKTSMSSDYTPELYATNELESYSITMYQ